MKQSLKQKQYVVTRLKETVFVRRDTKASSWAVSVPVEHIPFHSPAGMDYGYAGSGAADMALSILADHLGESPAIVLDYARHGARFRVCTACHGQGLTVGTIGSLSLVCPLCSGAGGFTGPESLAWKLHQRFKRDVVERWDQDVSVQRLDAEDLDTWIAENADA